VVALAYGCCPVLADFIGIGLVRARSFQHGTVHRVFPLFDRTCRQRTEGHVREHIIRYRFGSKRRVRFRFYDVCATDATVGNVAGLQIDRNVSRVPRTVVRRYPDPIVTVTRISNTRFARRFTSFAVRNNNNAHNQHSAEVFSLSLLLLSFDVDQRR